MEEISDYHRLRVHTMGFVCNTVAYCFLIDAEQRKLPSHQVNNEFQEYKKFLSLGNPYLIFDEQNSLEVIKSIKNYSDFFSHYNFDNNSIKLNDLFADRLKKIVLSSKFSLDDFIKSFFLGLIEYSKCGIEFWQIWEEKYVLHGFSKTINNAPLVFNIIYSNTDYVNQANSKSKETLNKFEQIINSDTDFRNLFLLVLLQYLYSKNGPYETLNAIRKMM